MSNIDKCIKCDDYEPIADGYGVCMRNSIAITVIADYEPTKNYNHCEKKQELSSMYGEMAYQKDEPTPKEMAANGWCDDCTENLYNCERNNRCEGYRRYNESIN